MTDEFDKESLRSFADVSRETIDKLVQFELLLRKWNQSINIVSASSMENFWQRHIFDSSQLLKHCEKTGGHWVDLGSGGGLPGLVVAIIAREKLHGFRFTLVESDLRKATFLRTVARELELEATVISERIEKIENLRADVISARALAPLCVLLEYAATHLRSDGQALFLKGITFRKEFAEAVENWSFSSKEYVSETESTAVVLSIGAIKRV